jgi:hypothetical protein
VNDQAEVTVALGRNAFDPNKPGAIDEKGAVDPWELEKQPNPVHFPHLQADTSDGSKVVHDGSLESIPSSSNLDAWFHALYPSANAALVQQIPGTPLGTPVWNISQQNPSDKSSMTTAGLSSSVETGSSDTGTTDPMTPFSGDSSRASVNLSESFHTSLVFDCENVDLRHTNDSPGRTSAYLFPFEKESHSNIPSEASSTKNSTFGSLHDLHCSEITPDDTIMSLQDSIIPTSRVDFDGDEQRNTTKYQPKPMEVGLAPDGIVHTLIPEEKLLSCAVSLPSSSKFTCSICSLQFPSQGKLK